MRFHRVCRTIVAGVSAALAGASATQCDDASGPGPADATPADATLDAAWDGVPATYDATDEDAPVDAFEPWCDAGPPEPLGDGGDPCYHYFYVPCGVPGDVTMTDAGTLSRCAPICTPFVDDLCAALPPPWPDVIVEAGLIDSAALTEAGVFTLCACSSTGGRAPEGLGAPRVFATSALGAHFAHLAHLEAASVPAFARIHAELAALGAPERMLADVRRAIADEHRHARIVGRLARGFGGRSAPPRAPRCGRRSVEAMARENAVEGCVREAFGALVATWQARHAADAAVRRAMRRLARDEARHAELSFRIAALLDARLDVRARGRVRSARRGALARLERELRDPPREVERIAGVPSARVARKLLRLLAEKTRELPIPMA